MRYNRLAFNYFFLNFQLFRFIAPEDSTGRHVIQRWRVVFERKVVWLKRLRIFGCEQEQFLVTACCVGFVYYLSNGSEWWMETYYVWTSSMNILRTRYVLLPRKWKSEASLTRELRASMKPRELFNWLPSNIFSNGSKWWIEIYIVWTGNMKILRVLPHKWMALA